MARQVYGQTWWGSQWLNALTHIDYDNRLPHGRSYANKGAVRDLTVQGGTIQAKVKGSRAQPYQIAIEVPSTPENHVKDLLDQIAAAPALIARLLSREIDGNPFLVFSLRGIDPAQVLKSYDIHIEREAEAVETCGRSTSG